MELNQTPEIDQYKKRLTNFSQEFDLGLFFALVRQSIWWIVGVFLLAIALSFFYTKYTNPIYESNTRLQIGSDNNASGFLNVAGYEEDNSLQGKLELLRSKLLVKSTLKNLPLEVSYFAEGNLLTNEHYLLSPYRVRWFEISDPTLYNQRLDIQFENDERFILSRAGQALGAFAIGDTVLLDKARLVIDLVDENALFEDNGGNDLYFHFNRENSLADRFLRGLNVKIINSVAQTVEISYKHSNRLLAKDFCEALAAEFIRYDLDKKQRSDEHVIAFIDNQIDTVYAKLSDSEAKLSSYRQENKISDLQAISGVYLNRLNQFEEDLARLDIDENILVQVEQILSAPAEDLDLYNLSPLLAGSQYQNALSAQLQQLESLLVKREEALYNFTEDNLAVKSLNYQINIQRDLVKESLRTLRKRAGERRKLLNEKLAAVEGNYSNLPSKELEFARLQRLFSINEKYYTMLLEKSIEYKISKEGYVTNNQILRDAQLPSQPISPRKKLTYLTAILFSLVFAFLFLVGRYLFHNRVSSLNEIIKLSEASIKTVGVIPRWQEVTANSQLVVHKKPRSILAESFRSLRTKLDFMRGESNAQVAVITSTISGEGKTFVALNLAGIESFTGKRVVVLDLDLRKPKVHIGLGLDLDQGMSNVLAQQMEWKTALRSTQLEGLDFISAGPVPPNPAELLNGKVLEKVLAELKAEYDVVVIDTPPVGLVSDAMHLLRMADFPLYIFRAGESRKQFVQLADRLINENGIANLSVVLNDVALTSARYKYSNYGYGYGYGYSQNNAYFENED